MTNLGYEFSSHDQLMVNASRELVEKLARSEMLSPAQRVSVAKLQLVLSRLPRTTEEFDLRVEVTGPRRHFGDIETYHYWTFVVEGEMLTVAGGGHFYQPSSGGDSFSTFRWASAPGEPSEYIEYLEDLAMVPDAAGFDEMVRRIDFEKAQYEVEVTDSDNAFLDEDGDDDEDEDVDEDSESEPDSDHGFVDTQSESDDDDPAPGSLQILPVDEAERELAFTIDLDTANRMPPQYAYGVEHCDFCKRPVENMGLLVDGDVRGGGGWANMCAKCFELKGLGVAWGTGQLYAKQRDGMWRMAKGFQRE